MSLFILMVVFLGTFLGTLGKPCPAAQKWREREERERHDMTHDYCATVELASILCTGMAGFFASVPKLQR